jgi:hypothetical protein
VRFRKEVTPGAAGRIREVLLTIGVTAQADIVTGAFGRPMPGVATATRRMLDLLVQTAQLRARVASRASGRGGDA